MPNSDRSSEPTLRNERDVDLLVGLLAEHSRNLSSLSAALYESRRRSLLVVLATIASAPLMGTIGLYLAGQFGLASGTAFIILVLLTISLFATVLLVILWLMYEIARRAYVRQDIRIARRQLERVARVASETEEHAIGSVIDRVRLEASLFEAEEILRRVGRDV
jgi:hypothetical protein